MATPARYVLVGTFRRSFEQDLASIFIPSGANPIPRAGQRGESSNR